MIGLLLPLLLPQGSRSYVTIPDVPYGEAGPFAVAVWAKLRLSSDGALSYVFSHNNTAAAGWDSSPNTVGILVPDKEHPGYGVVRAVLRDSTDDAASAGSSTFFVDSSGCVANQDCGRPKNETLVRGLLTPASLLLAGCILVAGQWMLSRHEPRLRKLALSPCRSRTAGSGTCLG